LFDLVSRQVVEHLSAIFDEQRLRHYGIHSPMHCESESDNDVLRSLLRGELSSTSQALREARGLTGMVKRIAIVPSNHHRIIADKER
jgi:hypothetical protein